jgi:uncharacterized protein (TIGR02996 family)
MADVMAIVSKAVFEKAAGKTPAPGAQLGMDRYVSANKNLAPVAGGGKLYLVTVRPPDEKLWLVAILDAPAFDGAQWVSAPSSIPITDITHLRTELRFESGAGITAKPGALGMSLQTPRVLTAEDVARLDAAAGGTAGEAGTAAAGTAAAGERDQRAQLLGAVLADPDSDLPKQVYADHLLQAGDLRGELIQLELALAGPLAIRKRDQLTRRHAELLAANRRAWFPYKITAYRTRGGFIRSVRATLVQLRAATALFSGEPVVEVEVANLDAAGVKQLVALPWLPRVRHLIIRGPIGDAGFIALWKAKAAAHLRSLNVTANGLTAKALADLGGGMSTLETLVLTANPIGDAGLEALRGWQHLDRLATLYLSKCRISAAGVDALLGGAPLARLGKLCLSHNRLDDVVGAAIASRAARLPALRHLELQETGVGTGAVTAVMAATLPQLATLDVRKNAIAAEDVAALAPRVRA